MVRIGMFLGDRYEILEKIGSGGMAEVFKGKDHKLNRFVAVKVLKDEFVEDRNFVRKFKEEAQAAAALAHPNIVNVYDVGDEQNINYIVMELVEGITLKTYIEKKGRLTVKEATSIAIQVASVCWERLLWVYYNHSCLKATFRLSLYSIHSTGVIVVSLKLMSIIRFFRKTRLSRSWMRLAT